MNEYIEIDYRREELREYVMELLTLGICSLFLRGSFVSKGDIVTAAYLSEGYRPLDSLKHISTVDALSVVTALFAGAHQCEKHYIYADEFELDSGCIYVKKDFSDVRVIYIPAKNRTSMTEKSAALLQNLAEKCTREGAAYLKKASDMIREDEYGCKSVLHLLEKLGREAYLCGIE